METMKTSTSTMYHLSIAKRELLRLVEKDGTAALVNFKGSKQEALEALREDKRDFFPIGSCDHREQDGSCAGHRE